MNPFESGERKVIPAVLVYLFCGDEVLMLHRNAPDRPTDYHAGKWNGLGGKLELDESAPQAAAREIEEEAGIRLPPDAYTSLGFLQFPNFKAHEKEDWLVFLFCADVSTEIRQKELRSPEGTLHWVPKSDVPELNLWEGDRHFISYILRREPVLGTIWYEGERVRRFEVNPLKLS